MKRASLSLLIAALLASAGAGAGNSPADAGVVDKEWRSYAEPLLSIGEHVAPSIGDPSDPQQRLEMYRQIFMTTSMAYLALFPQDAEHPDFWPIFNNAYALGSANPDDAYAIAPIDGKGVYKIAGVRGTVRLIDFQIGSGQFYPRGQGGMAPTFHNYDIDDLHIHQKDGAFEVVLSAARPAGWKGDWWQIDPRSTYVMVRQIAYDWQREVDGRFGIERLDRPAIRPRPSVEQLQRDLRQVAESAETWVKLPIGRQRSYVADGLVNKVVVRDLSAQGGFTQKQFYVEGLIDIADDEALIYETTVPRHCRYWNITTDDNLWNIVDYVNRQSSINGRQARIDKDGKFRAVVSAADPGVPNWLDTGGYKQGSLFGRWLQCDGQPTPSVTKVKLAEVRKYLPADTPTITAEQRDASLRLRRNGAQMRRRW